MDVITAPNTDPMPLFNQWYQDAKALDPIFYCGMNIATVDASGAPNVRVVLLKEIEGSDFIFYTNYNSDKGKQLEHNAQICANFWWIGNQRQIRIDGIVTKVSFEQSERYFKSRPQGSQLAAITSQQSQPIESIEQLEQKYDQIVEAYQDKPVECPKHWGGYKITPSRIEFWQGKQHRLHHRVRYERTEKAWNKVFLQP